MALIKGFIMSEVCETVTIETEFGPCDINKTDFDEKKHKLFSEKPKLVKPKAAKPKKAE